MQEPAPTPASIVDPDGGVHVGWFDRPFANANLQDAPVTSLLSGLRRTPFGFVERGYRRLRLKQWHFTGVVSEGLLLGCAVVDAGYVGNAFAYVVDRRRGKMVEYNALSPFGRGLSFARSSVDGVTRYEQPGWGVIQLDNSSAAGTRRVRLRLEGSLDDEPKPPLKADLQIRDTGRDPEPIIVVERCGEQRWLYTHKCYGLAAEGRVVCGELEEHLGPGDGLAGIDWNRGYRPTETYWNWAAAAGRAVSGERVGFNLTAHRSWKQPAPPDRVDAQDCALWLGRRRVKIRRVDFSYDHDDLLRPWRISDGEGLVELEFRPDGERADELNLGLLTSRFHQPYGTFRGILRHPDGARLELADVYGVTEQHFARW